MMDKDRFSEYLMIFGADVDRWPEEIRNEALRGLEKSGEFLSLQREHHRFEERLRALPYEAPDPDWPRRISDAARRGRGMKPSGLIPAILEGFADFHLPRPAIAAGFLLVVGLVVGFLRPVDTSATEQAQPVLQDLLYDDDTEAI